MGYKTKIYYVEDDENIANEVVSYLNQKGYDAYSVNSMAEAKDIVKCRMPELMLIDWNLPDGTGENLCKLIRKEYPELPVIFITVKDAVNDIINAFKTGADDYITKPFDLEILYSRINALLRRSGGVGSILTCNAIRIDKSTYKVFVDNKEIFLSHIEYKLLLLLMENKNHTVMRDKLLELIWDVNGNYVNNNTLTVAMKRLREKLHNPECIKTIRSFGYRMEEE
ncbi:MAG: response regulator transcription factor [Lachnospira sp.]